MKRITLLFALIFLVACGNDPIVKENVTQIESYTEVVQSENFDIYRLISEYSGMENFNYSDWYISNEHKTDINNDGLLDFVIHIKEKEAMGLSEGIVFIALQKDADNFMLHTAVNYKPSENFTLTKVSIENDEIKVNVVNDEPYSTFYKHYTFKYMTDDFYLTNFYCKTLLTDDNIEFEEYFDFIMKEIKIIKLAEGEALDEEIRVLNKEISKLRDIDLILYNPYE